MVFSSLPPNWQQQPNNDHEPDPSSSSGGGISNNNYQPALVVPPPLLPVQGSNIRPGSMADRARMANIPMPEAALKCPRCESSNTKFCYFNNYSLTQPRHFCKTCRRYWTRGGALRNVPVGGGFRRNKRSKAAKASPGGAAGEPGMNYGGEQVKMEDMSRQYSLLGMGMGMGMEMGSRSGDYDHHQALYAGFTSTTDPTSSANWNWTTAHHHLSLPPDTSSSSTTNHLLYNTNNLNHINYSSSPYTLH